MIMRGMMTLGTMGRFSPTWGFCTCRWNVSLNFGGDVVFAGAIERIFEFLDIKPEITDHPLSRPFAVRRGAVQFDRVSFSYGSRNGAAGRGTLTDLNLSVPGGSRVALVGRSGAARRLWPA